MILARYKGRALPAALRVNKQHAQKKSKVYEVSSPLEDPPAGNMFKHRTLTPMEGVIHQYYKKPNHFIEPADDLQKCITGNASLITKRRQSVLVLSVTAIALLGVLGLVFILYKESPPSRLGDLKVGVSPNLNCYSGKAVFEKKFLLEKGSRQGRDELLPRSLGNTDTDIEVSTNEQLTAMKEHLNKVRAMMVTEGEKNASGDARQHPLLAQPEATPRRFDINNFRAPRELISLIPKALQETY